MIISKTKDVTGRTIYLFADRLKHILSRHSSIQLEKIYETIQNPVFINKDEVDASINYYYKFYKENKRYLIVVVKYLNKHGFIITSFYDKKIRK